MSQGRNTVVDFTEIRAQRLEEKRRKTERILFNQMLGVYCVVGDPSDNRIKAIEMIDISEDGLAFQVPVDPKRPWPSNDKELTLRLYFSQDTYLPVRVRIQNARALIDQGVRYQRFGCAIDTTVSSFSAFTQFVRFLKLYAEHAHKDQGDASVFYL